MSSFMLKMATRAVETDIDGGHSPAAVPRAGLVINAILSMVTIAVLAIFIARRIAATRDWQSIPVTRWLIFAIYTDSIIFIIATNILADGFGVNLNQEVCSSTILLCLTCYLSTKVLIYYFLVEKVYIIQNVKKPRLQSKLWLFNCFGMLLPYCVVVALNYVYRISYLRSDGVCIIGMQKKSMMPLIILEVVVNLYLTMLFVIPIRKLYTYKNQADSPLRTIAVRSFFGAIATLTSAVVNLTVLMVLKGEPAWVCLMCCNADVLFSVVVLHWVTSKDSVGSGSSRSKGTNSKDITGGRGLSHGRDVYGLGSRVQPTVTTMITASKVDGADLKQSASLSDDELERGLRPTQKRERSDRMDWARSKRNESTRGEVSEYNGEKGYPLNKIRVQVGQVVEIESESNSDGSASSPRGDTMGSHHTVMGHRAGKPSTQSTEDLVERMPGGSN